MKYNRLFKHISKLVFRPKKHRTGQKMNRIDWNTIKPAEKRIELDDKPLNQLKTIELA